MERTRSTSRRPNSYLGKSDWGDPNFVATFDAFRVYNYLLNATTVQKLATAYGLYSPSNPIPTSYAFPATSESQMVNSLPGVTKPPIFNAVFGQDPSNAVGVQGGINQMNYGWVDRETLDPQSSYHQGIIQLNGSGSSFVDLSTNSGPNSCGLVVPVFGGVGSGSLANGTMGVTFDMVVKLNEVLVWSKLFDLGTGGYLDSLAFTWNGNSYGTLEVQNYVNVNKMFYTQLKELTFLSFPYTNQWYHIALVMQVVNLANNTANWSMYVNGVPSTQVTGGQGNYVLPVQRPVSFIGQSDWSDPSAVMTLDAFRIWDYALSPTTVKAISTAYGISPTLTPPVQPVYPYPSSTEDRLVLAALGSARPPVWNMSFPADPTTVVGLTAGTVTGLNYLWQASDPLDNAAQAGLHQGIVTFQGNSNNYIDLGTAYGPNSYGQVLPTNLFGATSGSGATAGWTFEIVVKFNATTTWAKIVNWGTGQYVDDFTLTYNGNDAGWICFENYNSGSATVNVHSLVYIFKPTPGLWYHIMVVMQQAGTAGQANYFIYVNGVQMDHATKLVTGAALTPIQGAAMPLSVWRQESYLGKSDWNDAYFMGSIDSIRMYDYALTAAQATALANVYGLSSIPNWPYQTTQTNANIPSTSTEATKVAAVLAGQTPPIFNAMFPTDPQSVIGSATRAYGWMQQDTNDSPAVQASHQGLIQVTSANPSSYVDLSLASGPNSVGLALPIFGGAGSGTGAAQGVSFEIVFKPTAVMSWMKFFDLGNGGGADSLSVGWWDTNGDVYGSMELAALQNCPTNQPGVINSTAEFGLIRPTAPINVWYHMVVVAQAVQLTATTYSGTWSVYVNGTRLPSYFTSSLTAQSVPYTAAQGGMFPFPIRRFQSFLGNSDWSGDGTVNALYDAFRVYDYALSAYTIQALANVYGLAAPPVAPSSTAAPAGRSSSAAPTTVSAPTANTAATAGVTGTSTPAPPPPPPGGVSSSSTAAFAPPSGGGSSGLSGGAIAGIVIGSVVGAALLCCILFFACCYRREKKGEEPPQQSPRKALEQAGQRVGGGYGQMEPSQVPSMADNTTEASQIGGGEEVEMTEHNTA